MADEAAGAASPRSPPPFFEAREATFGYPARGVVLQGVSVGIAAGERVGIIGANGAGKSTLLRGLIGLCPAISGTVRIDGREVLSLRRYAIARQVAYLPQELRPAVGLTALDVVLLGRAAHRAAGPSTWAFDTPDDVAAAHAALEEVGASVLGPRSFHALSGGERRLVVLAQALAQAGRGVLLDEPTAALDLRAQWMIAERLITVVERRGMALVLVSHDLTLAARVCGRLILLAEGAVVADGPPAEVLVPGVLSRAFGIDLTVMQLADRAPLVVPRRVIP